MSQPGIMPVSDSTNDDDSGLHDLEALASSTKQRRSQRLSSQMEAQASLLQSAASLEAVALPDPDKEQPVSLASVAIADAPLASASTQEATASAAVTSIGTPPASTSKLLVFGGLAILAAGAVAFYMMRGAGGDAGNNDSATTASAVVAPAALEETDEAEAIAPTPAAAEVVPLPVEDEEGAAEEEVAVTDEGAAEEASEELAAEEAEEVETAKSEKSEKSKKSDKPEKALTKAEKKAARAEKKAAKLAAKEEAKQKRELAKAEKKAAKDDKEEKAPTLGKGGASLDDVLSSVTGGVDKPIAEKKDLTPTKKKLERGDVSKAMKAITGSAKKCYSAEEFSGTVMVKYSVASSGNMTKATALGAHKSSKTGKCVVKAVKRAKFPAFSGATQSFTFPFLLSP